ncbi:MAG: alpha/beta hydrolase [Acidimicrobiales bacterium]
MKNRVVVSGSARLAVSELGRGSAVLLIHAGVADRRSWYSVMNSLADRWRVVAYDQRGFGDTAYEAETYSSVDDLVAVLDALEVERAVIVGCSRGGQVAFDAAFRAAPRVAGLVLIGSAPEGAPPSPLPSATEALFDEVDRAEEEGDIVCLNTLEAHLWLDGPESADGRVSGPARDLFLDMNGRALAALPTGEHEAPTADWRNLSEVRVPTVVIAGRLDLAPIQARAREMSETIPGAHLVMLDESAHLPMLDCPEVLVSVLSRFLETVVS